MTIREEYDLKKDRYDKLSRSPKNIKCPGVLRKLRRQLRGMLKES